MSKQLTKRESEGLALTQAPAPGELCGFGAPCCPFPACTCDLCSQGPLSCVPCVVSYVPRILCVLYLCPMFCIPFVLYSLCPAFPPFCPLCS